MPQRHRPAYPPEFREQLVEPVRAGRPPEELAKEYEPSAQTIRNWRVSGAGGGGKWCFVRATPTPSKTERF